MSRDNPYFRFNLWNLTGKTSCFLCKVVNEKGVEWMKKGRVGRRRRRREEEEQQVASASPARPADRRLSRAVSVSGEGPAGRAPAAPPRWSGRPRWGSEGWKPLASQPSPSDLRGWSSNWRTTSPSNPTKVNFTRETSVVIQSEKFRVVLHPSSIIIVWRPLSRRLNDC